MKSGMARPLDRGDADPPVVPPRPLPRTPSRARPGRRGCSPEDDLAVHLEADQVAPVGRPRRKSRVPSIGSTIQRRPLVPSSLAPSSPRKPSLGKAARSSDTMSPRTRGRPPSPASRPPCPRARRRAPRAGEPARRPKGDAPGHLDLAFPGHGGDSGTPEGVPGLPGSFPEAGRRGTCRSLTAGPSGPGPGRRALG